MHYQIVEGNRAAVITANDDDGPFSCRLWVNVLNGLEGADATLVSCKRKTMRGAIKWAYQQLGKSLPQRAAWEPTELDEWKATMAGRKAAAAYLAGSSLG